jgi:hypothetical protein
MSDLLDRLVRVLASQENRSAHTDKKRRLTESKSAKWRKILRDGTTASVIHFFVWRNAMVLKSAVD